METGFGEGDHRAVLLIAFDHEEVEDFAAVDQVVLIAEFFAPVGGLVARISGDDAVDQRVHEGALLLDVVLESGPELPVGGVAEDAVTQRRTVLVDELAGDEHQPLLPRLEPLEEQAGELGRIGDLRFAGGVGFRLVFDARLGGVREDQLQIGRDGALDDRLPVAVGLETPLDAGDDALVFGWGAVLHAAEDQRVEPVLRVDEVGGALRQRLNQLDHSVELARFVGLVDHPVDEGAQEVAFAELHDLDRILLLRTDFQARRVDRRQKLAVECFHHSPLYG